MSPICSKSPLLAVQEGFRQAVINGDTLAVGILLNCLEHHLAHEEKQQESAESTQNMTNICVDFISPLHQQATELQHLTIASKLTEALARCLYPHGTPTTGRPEYNRSPAANRNEFALVHAPHVSVFDSLKRISDQTSRGGYTFLDVFSRLEELVTASDASVEPAPGLLREALLLLTELPVCNIDTYDINAEVGANGFDIEAFYSQIVLNNKPVRFVGDDIYQNGWYIVFMDGRCLIW
jgi:hypothetical protein